MVKTLLPTSGSSILSWHPLYILALGTCLMGCHPSQPVQKTALTLYVSTSGNDNWSGKLSKPNNRKSDGPLASLEAARNVIRGMRATGGLPRGTIVVQVQGGLYELARPLELTTVDGGSDSVSRVIYMGEPGAEVRLSGGRMISNWEAVTSPEVLNRLSPGARDKIVEADLRAAGITGFGSPGGNGMELFFNDQPMWISRYPNKGFVKIVGLYNEDPVDVRGTKGDYKGKFRYDDPRLSHWQAEKDAWVHGYWFWDWSEERHKIARIDTLSKTIEVTPPYHRYGYRLGQWFYGFNLLSEIDEPGEYYVDREEGILYFYPPSDVHEGQSMASVIPTIITLDDASFVTVQGITLEGSREAVIRMNHCENCVVDGCILRNAGDWAVTITEGKNSGVTGSEIYQLGGGGVRIEAGDRKTLVSAGCYVDNNYIHHTARTKRVYYPCVSLYGVGNRVLHNVLAEVPHMAVYFYGNDHLIEYNEIYNVCYETNDAGAIYAGRDWTMRGNIIRFNYLHDITGFEGKGCVGLYLDDAFASAEVSGNIFQRVTRAMMIGGGRDNVVVNNIFIDCVPSLHIDGRGLNWMAYHIDDWLKEEKEKGTILGIAYNKPPYSTRYPKLINIIHDEPYAPKGNLIARNICLGGNWDKPAGFWNVSIEGVARPYLSMENNIVSPTSEVEDPASKGLLIVDPMFVDPKDPLKGKFQLAPGSPALERGFKQIPFEKIGLVKSEPIRNQ